MEGGRRRLTREDLEAMRKEFGQGERYAGALAYSLDDDLHQTPQSVRCQVGGESGGLGHGPGRTAGLR